MTRASQQLMKGLIEAFILDHLAREPVHGYVLTKWLGEVFGEKPTHGRIYPLLTRLQKEGLIAETPAPGDEGREKTAFSLTGKGVQRLRDYKVMPESFKMHLAAFFDVAASGPEKEAPASASVEAPAAPGPGRRTLGCDEASIRIRRHPGKRDVAVELDDCDLGNRPGCPTCPVPAMLRRAAAEHFF